MATSQYSTTSETTNAGRASRVLLGPCSAQLRDLLRDHVPPQKFPQIIRQKMANHKWTKPQRDLILPSTGQYSGNYSDFDISLLYTLLRNLCNIPKHKNGWGNDPDSNDMSLAANIERIRICRNRLGHALDFSLSDLEFNDIWSSISTAVIEIDKVLKSNHKHEKDVDFLRYEPMDFAMASSFEKVLRKQYMEDIEIKSQLSESQNVLGKQLADIRSNQDMMTKQFENLTKVVGRDQQRIGRSTKIEDKEADQYESNSVQRTDQFLEFLLWILTVFGIMRIFKFFWNTEELRELKVTEVSDCSVLLKWESRKEKQETSYIIEYRNTNSEDYVQRITLKGCEHKLDTLQHSTEYEVQVKVATSSGEKEHSKKIKFKTEEIHPAPRLPFRTVQITPSSITAEWGNCEKWLSDQQRHYILTCTKNSETHSEDSESKTEIIEVNQDVLPVQKCKGTVSELLSNTIYSLKVKAENGNVVSSELEMERPTKTKVDALIEPFSSSEEARLYIRKTYENLITDVLDKIDTDMLAEYLLQMDIISKNSFDDIKGANLLKKNDLIVKNVLAKRNIAEYPHENFWEALDFFLPHTKRKLVENARKNEEQITLSLPSLSWNFINDHRDELDVDDILNTAHALFAVGYIKDSEHDDILLSKSPSKKVEALMNIVSEKQNKVLFLQAFEARCNRTKLEGLLERQSNSESAKNSQTGAGLDMSKQDVGETAQSEEVRDMPQQDIEETAQSEEVRAQVILTGDEEILSQMYKNPNLMKDLNDMIENNGQSVLNYESQLTFKVATYSQTGAGLDMSQQDVEDNAQSEEVRDMSQQDVEENAQSEEVRGDEEILSQMFENPNCMKDLNDMIEKNVIKEKLSKQNSKDSPEGNTKIKLRLSTLPPAEDGSKMKEKILRRSFPHVLHKCLPNSIIEEIKKLKLPSQFRTKAMEELNKSENDDNLTKNRFLMTMLLREDTISEESTSCLMKNLVGSDILDYELKRNPGDIVGKIGENYGHILRELHGNIIMKMNEIYAVFGDEVFRSDSKSDLDRSALFLEDVLTKESKVLDLANMLSMLELDSLLHDKESEIGQDISQGKSHEKQDHEDEKDYSSRNKTVLEKKLAEAKEKFQTNNLMLARHSMNSDEVVFIGFDEKCAISEEVRAEFDGIKVYLRHPYYVDDEARRIAEFKGHNHGEISESREKLITSWILANSDRVWESHSNLRVLSSDCFKSTSTVITNKPCIVFYCRWKGFIPFQEVAFPSFVEYGKERIDVDVREGYFYLSPRQGEICSASPYQYNDPLCMGSCIGEKNKEKCGSLGLFVQWNRKRTSRKVNGFITCSHVLFECTHLAHFDYFQTEHDIKHVVQPATGCSPQETINSICGKVTVAHFHTNTPKSVDIAVVEVSERMPSTSGFIITLRSQITDAGFNRETFPEYTNGRIIKEIPSNERRQPVVKSGTATGFTSGQLRLTATEVYIEKKGAELGDSSSTGKRIMKGQYEVYKTTPTPFSIPGDSGAAVFLYDTQKKLNCIGIVIGNTSGGSTVVTPIGNILECLGFDESNIVRFPPTTDEEV